MKITETVEREYCVDYKDLRPYNGDPVPGFAGRTIAFCVHCGQIWVWSRTGEASLGYLKLPITSTEPLPGWN